MTSRDRDSGHSRASARHERTRAARRSFHLGLAEWIGRTRERLGLTQEALAARVGTTQPVIARLERANYDGHSLVTLRRVAAALGHRLEVRFVGGRPAAKRSTGGGAASSAGPKAARSSSKRPAAQRSAASRRRTSDQRSPSRRRARR
jgi:transcriptional regulator with XRE-family HTH domain